MSRTTKPIPDGFHSVTAALTIRGADRAIDFYKKAFGAEEILRMFGPDGRIMHAQIRIGDSAVMIHDEFPEMGGKSPPTLGGSPVHFYVFVSDCDAAFAKAVAAGATAKSPCMDMFWGDRYGQVGDPFGYAWALATHKVDMTPEEIAKAQANHFARMASQKR
jgi:uncharacterized glyoxalase superfamily protein PhnB